MREIELKFKAPKPEAIISFLESENCQISEPTHQYDTIYVQDLTDVESKEGSVWLRVRKTDTNIELNYKKQSAQKMESEEIEFEVGSYEKANAFLKALGFQEWVQVNKKRRYTTYEDANICIDEVERLGTFIEIEMLIDQKDDVDYEQKLTDIACKIGLSKSDRINSHYDTMISELDTDN